MDEKTALAFISDNAASGAALSVMGTILYKVWRILKSDRKVDNLDDAERLFREELKQEITSLRKEVKALTQQKMSCEKEIQTLRTRLSWLESCLHHCKLNAQTDCPLINHLGRERFEGLTQD